MHNNQEHTENNLDMPVNKTGNHTPANNFSVHFDAQKNSVTLLGLAEESNISTDYDDTDNEDTDNEDTDNEDADNEDSEEFTERSVMLKNEAVGFIRESKPLSINEGHEEFRQKIQIQGNEDSNKKQDKVLYKGKLTLEMTNEKVIDWLRKQPEGLTVTVEHELRSLKPKIEKQKHCDSHSNTESSLESKILAKICGNDDKKKTTSRRLRGVDDDNSPNCDCDCIDTHAFCRPCAIVFLILIICGIVGLIIKWHYSHKKH